MNGLNGRFGPTDGENDLKIVAVREGQARARLSVILMYKGGRPKIGNSPCVATQKDAH